jgi:transposase
VEPPPPETLTVEALLVRIERLDRENVDLREKLAAALAEIARLRRRGQRQATPFSTGTRKEQPQKPGRKPGQGPFTFRAAPEAATVTARLAVPLAATACSACGGALLPTEAEVVTVTDLPPRLRPEVTAYHLGWGRCAQCGKRVRARHPAVAADQRGATAHRLGPRLMAAAHWLHYGAGVPVRKLPAVLATLTGIRVTQGALTQDALRRAAGSVGTAYQTLREAIPQAAVVYTDDTGWKVGGERAFLMTFTTPDVTVFQIRERHRNDEVRELIPSDYAGVMVCDRARSYDARPLQAVQQQKCLAHVQRSLSEALADQWGRARSFGLRLRALLAQAMALWRRQQVGELTAEQFATQRQQLQAAVREHLRPRRLTNPTNRRLLAELGWQHDQGNLLRFLFDPQVEPTNNRAERALRPGVIARKVSQCSKNPAGAAAHAAFVSVVCTLRQRGEIGLVEALVSVFTAGAVRDPPERSIAACHRLSAILPVGGVAC